tara:strand:+ start:2946 stop:3239 length:294 start_codon:yes stop_codon:yes gene_type:complete
MKTEYNKRLEEEILKLKHMLRIADFEIKRRKGNIKTHPREEDLMRILGEKNKMIKKLHKDITQGEEVKRLYLFIEGSKKFLTKEQFLSLFNKTNHEV